MYSSHSDWNQDFWASDMLFSFILVFLTANFQEGKVLQDTNLETFARERVEMSPITVTPGSLDLGGKHLVSMAPPLYKFFHIPLGSRVCAYFFSLLASLECKTPVLLVLLSWFPTWAVLVNTPPTTQMETHEMKKCTKQNAESKPWNQCVNLREVGSSLWWNKLILQLQRGIEIQQEHREDTSGGWISLKAATNIW